MRKRFNFTEDVLKSVGRAKLETSFTPNAQTELLRLLDAGKVSAVELFYKGRTLRIYVPVETEVQIINNSPDE